MNCQRCQGLMVNDITLEADSQSVETVGLLRCLTCGERVDPTILANRAKPTKKGVVDRKLHHTKFCHEIIAVSVKEKQGDAMPRKVSDDQILNDFLAGQDPSAISHFRKVSGPRVAEAIRARLRFYDEAAKISPRADNKEATCKNN